jgi:hypothetical protein
VTTWPAAVGGPTAVPPRDVSPRAADRPAVLAVATSPGRNIDVLPLTLTREGRIADPRQIQRIQQRLPEATDCFVFCPGWLDDEGEAAREAARFFTLLDLALAPAGERVLPLRVGLYWPSKPHAASRRPADIGFGSAIAGTLGRPNRSGRSVAALLAALCRDEIPASVEEEAELDLLLRRLLTAQSARGALPISAFHALSFWLMKRRAGEVGERLGRECLSPLWRSLTWAPRLHLIGHSFGARLATSAVLGGARPTSLTLLLAAFSAFAFAPAVPSFERPGVYHRVLGERSVSRPIVVLRSIHDTTLRTFYPASIGTGQASRLIGRKGAGSPSAGRHGHARTSVATSALGAVGARGVGAPEIDLLQAQQTGIPSYPIVNVDGSSLVRARDRLMGAHRNIHHPEVAMLIGMAAGVLVGGPAGPRPVPVDPRVQR